MYIIIIYLDKDVYYNNLPGQGCILQDLVWLKSPTHALPPNIWPKHDLLRSVSPPPHVTVQSDHTDHSPNVPSTTKQY
jgi:hypothetical protein